VAFNYWPTWGDYNVTKGVKGYFSDRQWCQVKQRWTEDSEDDNALLDECFDLISDGKKQTSMDGFMQK